MFKKNFLVVCASFLKIDDLLAMATFSRFSSNGNLDPWSGLGVLEKPSPSIVTVMIDQGAHHLDLRKKNPLDPDSVIKAREIEKAQIKLWIS